MLRHIRRFCCILLCLSIAAGSVVNGQFALIGDRYLDWNEADQFNLHGELATTDSDGDGLVDASFVNPSLRNLNVLITNSVDPLAVRSYCYSVSGIDALSLVGPPDCATDPTVGILDGRLDLTGVGTAPLGILVGKHVDYEFATRQTLTLVAHNALNGSISGSIDFYLTLIDFNERPHINGPFRVFKPIYLRPGNENSSVDIRELFEDPEKRILRFDLSNASQDVWICDTGVPGNRALSATRPTVSASGLVSTTSGTLSNCDVSNISDTRARGNPGSRVVSTRKLGPRLQIRADQIVTAQTPSNSLANASAGVYTAYVLFRVWDGPPNTSSSSDFAIKPVHVKVGANNEPQFEGGASGFNVNLSEGTNVETVPMNAWVAGDLDSSQRGSSNTRDQLSFSLQGQDANGYVAVAGGRISLGLIKEAAPTADQNGDGVLNDDDRLVTAIKLVGENIDYETADQFVVYLEATDHWSPVVSVPITVTVENVNELVVSKPIGEAGILHLIEGLERTFDLSEHFFDAEMDTLTFDAYSSVRTDIVNLDANTGVLSITGRGSTANADYSEKVYVEASDGQITVSFDFDLQTRFESQPPQLDLINQGAISVGYDVDEADSSGYVLHPLLDYSDDDQPIVLMDHDFFDAVVDPRLSPGGDRVCDDTACIEHPGQIAIVSKELNYEEATEHNFSIALQDKWDPNVTSGELQIVVRVGNSNDTPVVVKVVPNQRVTVLTTSELNVREFFSDEDGDRLILSAESSNDSIASVNVSGLDDVSISGVTVGEASITLTADDGNGATVSQTFRVYVEANVAPVANVEVFDERFPDAYMLRPGTIIDIPLNGLFTDPDTGDEVVETTVSSYNESVLILALTDEGQTATLIPLNSGLTTLTFEAVDRADNVGTHLVDVRVNSPPEVVSEIQSQTLDTTTPLEIDISGVFTDDDDGADSLTVSASTIGDGAHRATVAITELTLTITGVEAGDATIELTATDPYGAKATTTFTATVESSSASLVSTLDQFTLDRSAPLEVDLKDLLQPTNQDVRSIVANADDSAIVDVVIEGSMLLIKGVNVGSTTITLAGSGDHHNAPQYQFPVTVLNLAPIAQNPITDQSTSRVDQLTLQIDELFTDPDADDALLTYSAQLSDENLANIEFIAGTLNIQARHVGETSVTLTATDMDGGSTNATFLLTVENTAPTFNDQLNLISLEVGGDHLDQDLDEVFIDDDHELLYSLATSNEKLIKTSIAGSIATFAPLSRGMTTASIVATDPHGATTTLSVKVIVNDTELKSVAANTLSGVGRSMLSSISTVINSRVNLDRTKSDLSTNSWQALSLDEYITLAPIQSIHAEIPINSVRSSGSFPEHELLHPHVETELMPRTPDPLRSGVSLRLNDDDQPAPWSIWSSSDAQFFGGDAYNGTLSNTYLGIDKEVASDWIAGVALSRHISDSEYSYGDASQQLKVNVHQLMPYARYSPSQHTQFWGSIGLGEGDLLTTVVRADDSSSRLTSQLAILGGKHRLSHSERFELAFRGDASSIRLATSDGSAASESIGADVHRVRAGIDTAYVLTLTEFSSLKPFGEFNFRTEGVAGRIESGIEFIGGFKFSHPLFAIELVGNHFETEDEQRYSEQGVALTISTNSSLDGSGFSASVAPRWGVDARPHGFIWIDAATSATDSRDVSQPYGPAHDAQLRVDTHFGYGLLIANDRFLLTPFIQFAHTDTFLDHAQLGTRLQHLTRSKRSLSSGFSVGHVHNMKYDAHRSYNAFIQFHF